MNRFLYHPIPCQGILIQEIETIGLTSGEARVYVSLVKLRESTVGPISKESGVAYSKVYDVLSRLMEKGLVSVITKEKTKYFHPSSPQRLYDYIEAQKKSLDKSKTVLDTIIPRLENLNATEQESVRLFYGFNGIMTAYEIMLSHTRRDEKVMYFYQNDPSYAGLVKQFYTDRPQFFELLRSTFKEKNVIWKGIYSGEGVDPEEKFMSLKQVTIPLPGNIDVTEYHVLITTWSTEPKAVLIHSKEMATNFRKYFKLLWDSN
ncbi:MAG: TrmB family transcriptional regulator [Nanobdellota archaeon]